VLGRVHPTQLYTALAAMLLLGALLWLLPRRIYVGDAAGVALIAGGLADFSIGLLRQPYETYGESWLDPAQATALLLVLGGGIVLALQRPIAEKRAQIDLRETEAVHAE
jgi:prolipoprotein diacylglyceryltransferase